MKIEMMDIEGIVTRVLVVDEYDKASVCENCGGENYNHELLAKEDTDWCMDCNDNIHRKDMSALDVIKWAFGQMLEGKAVLVVRR